MPLVDHLADLQHAMSAKTDTWQAQKMAVYMGGNFEFYGIQAGPRRQLQKPVLEASSEADAAELLEFALACWDQPRRELHYTAVDVLRKRVRALGPDEFDAVGQFVRREAWWDTIDALAAWVIGMMVKEHRELQPFMDEWIVSTDVWVARTAMLHQLGWRAEAEAERLFHYALTQADNTDDFMRKAIGWALRQHGRVEPDEVRAFVAEHEDQLSGLTRREALKRL